MTDKQPRDVRGRFQKMGDSIEDIRNASAADVRPGMVVPRYGPTGDGVAGASYPGPLQPRAAVMTGEPGRPWAQQARYIMGDVDATAPGEVAATARYGIQGRWGREAARRSTDPMSPVKHLTGASDD